MASSNITKQINEAWLMEYARQEPAYNPLDILRTEDDNEFEKKLAWLLSRPEFFSFTCRHIMNVELLPFQDVLLNEIWNRKFPMFVASRGAGKAVILNTKVLTDHGFVRMGDIKLSDLVYGRDGKTYPVTGIYPQGRKRVCEITLLDGRRIKCCEDHLWVVKINDEETVVTTNYIINNLDSCIQLPNCEPMDFGSPVIDVDPYNHALSLYDGGFNTTIESRYKFSSYDDRMSLIRGFLHKSGSQVHSGVIPFTHQSNQLLVDLSEVIRSLGLSCHLVSDTLNISVIKSKYISIHKAEYLDQYEDMQCISVGSPDNTFILEDYVVTHNTWLLALYSLMRALILPNRKIIIAGASFRQSRFLHEYMESIWRNAPILRDLCDNNSGPTRSPDVCTFVINNSTIKAIPIGNGDKIRGYRANDLIVDEFGCIRSSSIIQTDRGLIKLSDYLSGDAYQLMNIDNKLETPDKIFKTPKTDVYRIETDNGYHFECSNIHQVMTRDGWKLAKDLTTNDYLPLDINNYFPSDKITYNGIVLDEKIAWLIGILVSEGTVTNRNFVQVTNTDKSLIDKIMNEFPDLNWELSEKEPYIDNRGFNCKRSWSIKYSNTEFRTTLKEFGLSYDISLNKTIPSGILTSPKSVVTAFLSGLFEGDGTAFYHDDKGKKRIGVAYYTSSEELADTLQILLLKFNIICSKTIRNKSILSNRKNYMICLRGNNAFKIYDLLNVIKWKDKFDSAFFYHRKPTISVVTKKTTRYNLSTSIGNKNKHLGSFGSREEAVDFFNKYLESEKPLFRVRSVEKLPEQEHLYDFHMPETHSFVANGFIQHNSHNREIFETVLAGFGNVSANPIDNVKSKASNKAAQKLGINLNSLVNQNPLSTSNQIIISGTAFYDFHFFAEYWKKWKQIINSKGDPKKISEIFKGDIPPSFNWKDYSVIRIPYELIPVGFMDDANIARSRASVHSGVFEMEYGACVDPSTIIVTRAGLKRITDINVGDMVFTHKKRWRKVTGKTHRYFEGELVCVENGLFKDLVTPDHLLFDGETFIRAEDNPNLINYYLESLNSSITGTVLYNGLVFNLHVEEDESYHTLTSCSHNCFASDSKGFFKRSLIEACVASETNSISFPSGRVVFDASITGRKDCKYVIGVDPASEVDNFAIVVLEIHPDHRRVVHSWTINRQAHIERVRTGIVKEDNFYSYCARKIRELMRTYPTERIMLDSQGGGIAVSEALHESTNLYEGEVPIWPVIDEKKEKPSDDESGLHIIEMVNFASSDWTSEANHGLRKDLEDKILLFPKFDPVILALAAEQDKVNDKIFDTLEDCVTEIEELKNELVLIEITQTSSGRDKWDTPELKTGSNKKGRMRKDRYSALLMANMGARSLKVSKDVDSYHYGGFSQKQHSKNKINAEYIGPAWFVDGIRGCY